MSYTFDILGISPVLHFFNHQQELLTQTPRSGVEYLGTHKCTLDALIESVETLPPKRDWELDQVVNTVVEFWLNNAEKVDHWQQRLKDAGQENLLVARVADLKSLRHTFESLLGDF